MFPIIIINVASLLSRIHYIYEQSIHWYFFDILIAKVTYCLLFYNITVFDVVQLPFVYSLCKFSKILVVGNLNEQKFIFKILVLEFTTRKIFWIFFSLGTIQQSSKSHSVTFLKKFHHQLAFVIFNGVSQSNIFLVFFLYIWSFKVKQHFHHYKDLFIAQ